MAPRRVARTSFHTLILGLAGVHDAVITGAIAEEAVEHSGVQEQVLEIHETLGFVTFNEMWLRSPPTAGRSRL